MPSSRISKFANLIVPVVGNFGGPTALRAVGAYLKQHGLTVSAFYVSNVEQYLRQDGIWDRFCANAATLPVDATSTFIRSARGGFGGVGRGGIGGFSAELSPMAPELAGCAIGRARSAAARRDAASVPVLRTSPAL